MKTKVLICIAGGNLQFLATNNKEIDVVVVDGDNQEAGDDPVKIIKPDIIKKSGDFKKIFTFNPEIFEELDRLNF